MSRPPLSAIELTIALPHLDFAARRMGNPDGRKLLAVHGWLDNAASFDPIAPWFDDYDLVAIDLPGHGRSGHRPPGTWYHTIDYLNELLAIVEHLGWQRFSLLGHSLGAAIASVFAAAVPERVEQLFLVEGLGPLSTPAEKSLELLCAAMHERAGIHSKQMRVFANLGAPTRARMQHAQMPLSASAARLLVERGTRPVAGGFVWSSDPRLTLTSAIRLTEEQVRNYLCGIRCPARLVLADPPMPFVDRAVLEGRTAFVPTLDLIRLPGSHHLHMETPEAVALALRG